MICKPTIRVVMVTAILFLVVTSTTLAATYDFLTVTGNGIAGDLASTTFTSQHGNGVITVSHSFTPGGEGADDNNNAAIFPSQFTTLFPGTGQVQGHLVQTIYGETSVITFDLTGYNLSPSTVFGMWNTSSEVTQPAYRLQLVDASDSLVSPISFNLIGNQDNETQVAGMHTLIMNTSTGEVSAGALINGSGIHTDAAFWDNIPVGTKQIVVTSSLAPLNLVGDGVGYYFAEVVPEPTSLALAVLGLSCAVVFRKRRKR